VKAGEGQRSQLVIEKANEGWWSVANGADDRPSYVAKVGDELQGENGEMRLTVNGDTLEVIVLDDASNPITYTRQ
jgi:hypothetical protein